VNLVGSTLATKTLVGILVLKIARISKASGKNQQIIKAKLEKFILFFIVILKLKP